MIGFYLFFLQFFRTLYDGLTALGSIHSVRTQTHTCTYIVIIFNFLLYLFLNLKFFEA